MLWLEGREDSCTSPLGFFHSSIIWRKGGSREGGSWREEEREGEREGGREGGRKGGRDRGGRVVEREGLGGRRSQRETALL